MTRRAVEPLPFRSLGGFQEGMGPQDGARSFAERQRAQEIATLQEYAGHFGHAPHKLSMLTVATKQDLWWEHRDEGRRHYEGSYAQAIDPLLQLTNAQRLVEIVAQEAEYAS